MNAIILHGIPQSCRAKSLPINEIDMGVASDVNVYTGPLFSLSAAVATMLGSGGCVLIAKALGSDHIQEAKAYASLCFWGAIGFGIVIGVVLLSAGKAILPVNTILSETNLIISH